MAHVREQAKKAKSVAPNLLGLREEQRVTALHAIAAGLLENAKDILTENTKDVSEAHKNKLSSAVIDRLTLTQKSVSDMASMCREVARQEQVVGIIESETQRPNGLLIQKQRLPLGVIGMVFESRPNVVVDGAALAIKSGNAIILKGGKEAQHSNRILFNTVAESVRGILPEGAIALLETREDVTELLQLHEFIDLMIPRGGSKLIEFVRANATMPVVAHDKGLCHMYVHLDADPKTTIPIVLNGKVQRPGVCNAVETLLLHESYPENKAVIDALVNAGVEVRGCPQTQRLNTKVLLADPKDYDTEYLEKIISAKIVTGEDEAIEHIQKHTSHHTEAVLAKDEAVITKFTNALDSSAIVVNASTRFNDGGELGLGAELGISTSKMHAYGPMGAKEMTTLRYVLRGSGQIRT